MLSIHNNFHRVVDLYAAAAAIIIIQIEECQCKPVIGALKISVGFVKKVLLSNRSQQWHAGWIEIYAYGFQIQSICLYLYVQCDIGTNVFNRNWI